MNILFLETRSNLEARVIDNEKTLARYVVINNKGSGARAALLNHALSEYPDIAPQSSTARG